MSGEIGIIPNLELFWAVIPPLLLVYYYRRVAAASLLQLLLCFGLGALSGLVALGLEFGFEYLSSWLRWDTRSLAEVALRQLAVIGPIEEGCKLGGVLLFCQSSRRRDRDRPVTIYMLAIANKLNRKDAKDAKKKFTSSFAPRILVYTCVKTGSLAIALVEVDVD